MLSKLTGEIKNALSNCVLHFKQRDFKIILFNDINHLPANDWNEVVSDDVFWSVAYHQSLQNGCSDNMSFRYAIVYENKKPLAAFYFQLINLKNQSLNTILNTEYFSKAHSKINDKLKNYSFGNSDKTAEYVCIFGNLFVSGNYGVSTKDAELIQAMKKIFPEMLDMIAGGLGKKSSIFATVLKDFCIDDRDLFDAFEKSGFVPFEIDPDMVVPINKNWKHFDGYMQAFSSKYRVRANNALSKIETLLIKELTADEIKNNGSEISQLFHNVYNNAPVHIATNTAEYFFNLKAKLNERFSFKAYFDNGRIVAFSTAIINDSCTHAHHVGLDYDVNKKFALYQNILFNYVSDAIKNKSDYINLGRDALEIKSTVGAVPKHLKLFIRFSNSFTHLFLESFFKLTKQREWIQRKPFKEVI